MAHRIHTGDMLEVHRLAAAILCVGQHDEERHTRILLADLFAYRVVMPPHARMSTLHMMACDNMHGSDGRDDSFPDRSAYKKSGPLERPPYPRFNLLFGVGEGGGCRLVVSLHNS
jgi:hypothetical protein